MFVFSPPFTVKPCQQLGTTSMNIWEREKTMITMADVNIAVWCQHDLYKKHVFNKINFCKLVVNDQCKWYATFQTKDLGQFGQEKSERMTAPSKVVWTLILEDVVLFSQQTVRKVSQFVPYQLVLTCLQSVH